VWICLEDNRLKYYPTLNKGWKTGITPMEYPPIELVYDKSPVEDLGETLLRAFELSSMISGLTHIKAKNKVFFDSSAKG
jgi:hypothetical protein